MRCEENCNLATNINELDPIDVGFHSGRAKERSMEDGVPYSV
jgi:hypothetical protein